MSSMNDYAALWLKNPAARLVGGTVKNTQYGFTIKRAKTYDKTGENLVVSDIFVAVPPGEHERVSISYSNLDEWGFYLVDESAATIEEAISRIAAEAPVMTSKEWMDIWISSDVSQYGRIAQLEGNKLTVKDFHWHGKPENVGTLIISAYLKDHKERVEGGNNHYFITAYRDREKGCLYIENPQDTFGDVLKMLANETANV